MADQRVGILVEAIDKASEIFRRIGSAATANLSLSAEGAQKATLTLKRLPEMASKSAVALMAVNTATAQMGGGFAAAAQKATGLISLIGSGGKLGIAIAAITGLVMLGSYVWDTYKMAERNAESAARSLNAALMEQRSRMAENEKETRKLEEAVRNFGKTARQVNVDSLKAELEQRQNVLARLRTEQTLVLQTGEAYTQEGAERAKALEIALAAGEKEYSRVQRTLEAETQLQKLEEQKKNSEAAKTKSKSSAVARRSEALAKLKEELGLVEQQMAQGRMTNEVYTQQVTTLEALIARLELVQGISREYAETIEGALGVSEAARTDEQELAAQRSANMSQAMADLDAFTARRIMVIDEVSAYELTKAREVDAQQTQFKEAALDGAKAVGRAFEAAMMQWAEGSITGAQAAKQATLGAVRAAITAASGEAAAKALAAYAGIPFIGTAIGLAVAASLVSMILGYLGRAKGAAGGTVVGGISGRDSVPALLMPGEVVLSTKQVKLFDRLAQALEIRGGPQLVGASAGGGTVNLTIQSLTPSTPFETAKAGRTIKKAINRR